MDRKLEVSKWLLLVAGAMLLVRFISLGLYPLYDTTEARYGEIARIMFETQNWVTPQFDYNIPFWGKPPLHTWMSAGSFTLFGVSEFTARLPHFIAGLFVLLLVYRFVRITAGTTQAKLAVLVLSTCLGFIIAMGMVMTDTALLLAITLAMTSFWYCFTGRNSQLHGHLFFAALGLGMLAKGPVAVVLVGIALVVWSVYSKQLKKALFCLPWVSGLGVFLAITLPWYIWAEVRTPGFLNYFLVGEHFYRFVESGWSGDLYGSAHDEPKGSIWLFWLAAAFPWSFYLLFVGYKTKGFKNVQSNAALVPYLMAWIIAPMLLFTMAGNVLAIYVMPGFAALAILLALTAKQTKKIFAVAVSSFVLLSIALGLVASGTLNKSSESELLGSDRSFDQNARLYYWQQRPFSAQFYSKGQAQLIETEQALNELLLEAKPFYFVLKNQEYAKFSNKLDQVCQAVAQSRKRTQLACY